MSSGHPGASASLPLSAGGQSPTEDQRLVSLADLIARVEAAEGPSRRIDGDIADLLGLVPSWTVERSNRQPELWRGAGAGLNARTWLAPSYTASLDAALALVERKLSGWEVALSQRKPRHGETCAEWWHASLFRLGNGVSFGQSGGTISVKSATAAIALCLALLHTLSTTPQGVRPGAEGEAQSTGMDQGERTP